MVDPKIFRQYDIRGVWEKDLTEEAVTAIAKAFSVYLRENLKKDSLRVSIGRDVRLSSPIISEALTRGFLSSGIDVIDIGTCPTPLQYFSLFTLAVDGGVMITGSHNPPEFNGMKLSMGKETLFGEMIQDIRKVLESGRTISGSGSRTRHEIVPDYIDYISGRFGSLKGIKVVADAGNGTGGIVGPAIMRRLGAEVIELYCEPDGTFPNHHPDPVVLENLKDLIAKVRSEKAHLGIGWDGDSDRIGIVDEDGEVIWGDRLMIIFSREILKRSPGASIIGEVKCSQTLYDDIKARGGNPIMWMTGHSLIKKKLTETGGLLAGEMSGHIFFADRYFGYDDAIYAGLRLMEILAEKGRPYSVKALLKDVPVMVSTPEIRFECPDEAKFEIVERVKKSFKDYPVIDIDGVRVNFPEGWGLIRASNTQPALVMRFEAKDGQSLKKIRDFMEGELRKQL
ncbi:MAG: phosphomannomutase/phosphoglucomutase [Thermodesulfovibrionales bacterium]|nr:phosphomannomutase/phosphoglucomutase [Thermodesulfovibrionales bacterium]